jgi:hypothetical protein
MAAFNYESPAELFPSRSKKGSRRMGYRRFATAAEGIRFAIEQLPGELLLGAILEVNEQRFAGEQIRELYDSESYPLTRART